MHDDVSGGTQADMRWRLGCKFLGIVYLYKGTASC
jgi:hypothetical protein